MTMTTPIARSAGLNLSQPETLRALSAERANEPAWMKTRRADAFDTFVKLGLPTRRHEEWRFTPLRPLATMEFEPAVTIDETASLSASDIAARFALPGIDGIRLVFINGRYHPDCSTLSDVPSGMIVCDIMTALTDHAELCEPHLGDIIHQDDDAFDALSLATFTGGGFVYVPANMRLEKPVHVLSITSGDNSTFAASRSLIVVGDDAHATFVEDYVTHSTGGTTPDTTVSVAGTEILCGDRGDVEHVLIEREDEHAIHISTLASRQGEASRMRSHSALLGGKLVRNNVNPQLCGPKADSLLNGIYAPFGSQHIDNRMLVEHRSGDCTSRQHYRGMLTDDGSTVFSGRIVVSDDAAETDAVQNCRNLLLSDGSRAVTQPQLEIYDADVQCTHGATTGQIDAEQFFYLRARGVDSDTARGLLVYAFAAEGLERIDSLPLRQWIAEQLSARLPFSADLEEIL